MKPIPLMFMSDSPELYTGLARITKDLAVQVSTLPEFRVASFGRGGIGSSKLPFTQYNFAERQWGELDLEQAWMDFAGADTGIIMTIWDPSRLDWFSKPRMGGRLQQFLTSGKFKKWAYVTVDAFGVEQALSARVKDTLEGFDGILAYTIFGKQVLEHTLERPVDWIPHGYNPTIFQPRDKMAARIAVGLDDTSTLVGCVMTNQSRKDWGVAFAAVASLKRKIPDLKFWVHVDVIDRYWNIYALMEDFGLTDSVLLTDPQSHERMSYLYSACDVTFLPSHEGFGYTIVESLACGVPCIHSTYGAGAELVPDKSWLVPPVIMRLDTMWNILRPVFNPEDFTNTMYDVIMDSKEGALKEVCTRSVEHLQWKNLWPSAWRKWFLEGIK